MKIAVGCDHEGYFYKEKIKEFLKARGDKVEDFGTFSSEPCDYPDFVCPAAEAVAAGKCERAIVLGGSGNGEAITANKVRGIRCALCWDLTTARLSREHNDANVLSLGAWTVSLELALQIIDTWLRTEFQNGRHLRRIQKITEVEKKLSSGKHLE